jgi:electron transfer flavoprotein beta subunit
VKIVVLVKHVPSAVGGLSFASDLTVDRVGRRAQLNEADEFAVEQALQIALRRRNVRITAVTMGPVGAVDAVRKALVLGADEGVHVLDERLHGCDALATSRVLAAVVDRLGFDLVLCGTASADSGMSVVPVMVAERLGVAALCCADAWSLADLEIDGAEVGLRAAATAVRAARPLDGARAAYIVVEGEATSAAIRLVDFLAERQFL